MTQKRELTDKQQSFIQEYVRSGDAVEATRFAGYSHSTLGSLRAEASRLKRKLSSEIADELRFNMLRSAPKVIEMLKDLIFNAKSESVRERVCYGSSGSSRFQVSETARGSGYTQI